MNISHFPKISIITPSFNQGEFIEQTIQSVLNQNYPNLEYIIIDGGSTDNTVEIIKKYTSQISYWVSEPDSGQTEAINKGFQQASGEIFNWLNSDDYYEPGSLLEVAKAFMAGATCVAGYVRNFIEKHGTEDWSERTLLYSSSAETAARSANRQPGTFFRTDTVRAFFPLPPKLHYTMDQYLWISFLLSTGQKNIKLLNSNLVNFRWHHSSKTQSNNDRFALSYSEVFFNDLNTVFVNLAKQFNLSKEENILEGFFSAKHHQNNFSFNIQEVSSMEIKKMIHYFILELATDDFFRRNFARLSNLLKAIEPKLLDNASQKRLVHLKLKYTFRRLILARRWLINIFYRLS